MAEIVFAAGVPHAPGYVGMFDRAPAHDQDVVSGSYREVARRLKASRPDVLIVFANDHLTNSRIRDFPDFLIAGGPKHAGPHEWFKPWIGCRDYTVPGSPDVANALFRGMTRRDTRMSISDGPLNFDDNMSVPITKMDLDEIDVKIVPIMQNCTVPPYPDGENCYRLGQKLAELIRDDLPANMRVALLGSGGLSHEPGGVRYFKIDEAFDRQFIEICVAGDHRRLLAEITPDRMEEAGRGGTAELLSWFPVMAAIGEHPGETFGYSAWSSFRCGFGAVVWDLKATRN